MKRAKAKGSVNFITDRTKFRHEEKITILMADRELVIEDESVIKIDTLK